MPLLCLLSIVKILKYLSHITRHCLVSELNFQTYTEAALRYHLHGRPTLVHCSKQAQEEWWKLSKIRSGSDEAT